MDQPSLYSGSRFRSAIQHFLLGRAAQGIAFFIVTLWLVRLLPANDYGAYMTLWGMVEMMAPLSSLGMLEAVRRYLPELASKGTKQGIRAFVRGMTNARMVLLFIWAAVLAFFWPSIATWLGFAPQQQEASLVATGLIVTVLGFRYAGEMLECLLEQRWSQLTRALQPLGRLAAVAGLASVDAMSLERMLWVDLSVSLGCFLLTEYFLARRLSQINPNGDFRVQAAEVIRFSWHIAGANIFQAMSGFGALRLLVARTLGLEVAGMFAFLDQLLSILSRYLPANLLANIIRPMLITRQAAGDQGILGDGIALLWKINLIIIAACVVAMSTAGDEVIGVASGNRFNSAGIIVVLMLISLGATTQGQLIGMAMQIRNHTRVLRNFSVLSALTPVLVWLGAHWGLTGVALGMIVGAWIRNAMTLSWLNRGTDRLNLDWPSIARVFLLAVVLSTTGWFAGQWITPWLALPIVGIAFALGSWIGKPLNTKDMDLATKGLRGYARFLYPFVRTAI